MTKKQFERLGMALYFGGLDVFVKSTKMSDGRVVQSVDLVVAYNLDEVTRFSGVLNAVESPKWRTTSTGSAQGCIASTRARFDKPKPHEESATPQSSTNANGGMMLVGGSAAPPDDEVTV